MENNQEIQNVQLLRLDYALQVKEMALLAGTNEKTYQKYEVDSSTLNYKYILALANVFAVSLDWIVGRCTKQYKYNKDIILGLEQDCEETLKKIAKDYAISIPRDYSREGPREERYSEQARAAIVSYVRLITFFSKKTSQKKVAQRYQEKKKEYIARLREQMQFPSHY